MDALLFMQRIVSGIDPTQALNGTENLPPVRGGLKWAVTRGRHDFSLSGVLGTDEDLNNLLANWGVFHTDEEMNNFSADFVYSIDARVQANRCDILSDQCKIRSSDNSNTINILDGHLNSGRLTIELEKHCKLKSKKLFENIFFLDPIPFRMRSFSTFTDSLRSDASNIAGVMAALNADKKIELEKLFQKYLPNLPEGDIHRIWAEQVGRLQDDAMLYCEEKWHNGSHESQIIDARSMSDGTLRLLAILTALFTRPPGSLLVIEDVDQGLHPSRAGILVQMLKEEGKNRGVDLLVTTHNPALLDAMGPDMLPYITVVHRDPDTGESRLTLLEEAPQLAKLLAYGPVGRLATSGRIEEALRTRGTKAHGE
ncbi:MAG: ATP-binding protein [Magnetococcus sp. DMHC-1]